MVFKIARERKLANKDKNQKIKSPKAPRSESVKILPLSEELLKGLAKHAKVAAESRYRKITNLLVRDWSSFLSLTSRSCN